MAKKKEKIMLAQLISPVVSGLLDKFIEDKDQKNALAHEISTNGRTPRTRN